MVISHNIGAMNAQRQYNIVANKKAKSTEKLSSGYRINRAADDAAALSISEKMRRQVRGLTRGVENTEDGISLCQVADGALAEVHDMLQRINELSIQSANGTNSYSDRQAIQEEINQLLTEIDRIGETTSFNERKIFQDKIKQPDSTTTTITNTSTVEEEIQLPVIVSGTSQDAQELTYTILASEQEISINGDVLPWSTVLDENNQAINLDNPLPGKYTISYRGMNLSFEIKETLNKEHIIQGLDGISWSTQADTIEKLKFSLSANQTKTSGTTQPLTISADANDGIFVNGQQYRWSDFIHNGTSQPLDVNNMIAGNYKLDIGNNATLTLRIDAANTVSINKIAESIATTTITPDTSTEYQKAVTKINGFPNNKVTTLGSEYAKLIKSSEIKADTDGVWAEINGIATTKMTWAELGVDVNNPQAGSYHYSNQDNSFYFDFTINDNSSMNGIISGLNNAEIQYSSTCNLTEVESYLKYLDPIPPYNTYDEIYDVIHFVEPDDVSLDNPALSISANDEDLLKWFTENPDGKYSLGCVTSANVPLSFSIIGSPMEGMFEITQDSYNKYADYMNWERQKADVSYGGNITLEFMNNKGSILRLKLQDTRADFYAGNRYTTSQILNMWGETGIKIDAANSEYTYSYSGAVPSLYGNIDNGTEYSSFNKTIANKSEDITGTLKTDLDESSIPKFILKKNITETIEVSKINKLDDYGIWIQSGCDSGDGLYLKIDKMNTSILGINDIDVLNEEGANNAIKKLDGALEKVSSNRGKIGAQQNRLEHIILNENNIVENTTAAESRIRDADMAELMVQFSKENILAQVGQSMMAQSNQSNQGVLSLLQ